MTRLRRSFVLVAVLVIVGSSLLVVTGVAFRWRGEEITTIISRQQTQTQALAWSGLQAVMAVLDDQRQAILDGSMPRLDRQYVIYESGTRLGVARLLPVTSAEDRLAPESARIDVNHATASELALTGVIDTALADAIVANRGTLGRPFQSVAELLHVPGVKAETLYGSLEDYAETLSADDRSESWRAGSPSQEPNQPRGLADVATVFSIEPALQRSGRERTHLVGQWTDELAADITRRHGEPAAKVARKVMQAPGAASGGDGRIIAALRADNMPPENWPPVLDAFTCDEGRYLAARLNINEATYEALLVLPGVTPQQAAQIVQMRRDLSAERRATIAWPLLNGILTADELQVLAGRFTVRSWTYRVRIEVGEVAADDPDGPMTASRTLEAVIDLCDAQPRIAYLRDVTLLPLTLRVVASGAMQAEEDESSKAISGSVDASESAAPADDANAEDQPHGADSTSAPEATATPSSTGATGAATSPGARRIGRWLAGS